jgi:hypothetical protein
MNMDRDFIMKERRNKGSRERGEIKVGGKGTKIEIRIIIGRVSR